MCGSYASKCIWTDEIMVSFVLSFITLLRRNASLFKDIFPLVSYIVVLVNQYKLEEDFNPICIYVFSNCIQNRKILVSDINNYSLWTKYHAVDNII